MEKETEVEDPLEKMLNETGCADKHYKLQDCVAESHDWRKCQKEVLEFRNCMEKYRSNKLAELKSISDSSDKKV